MTKRVLIFSSPDEHTTARYFERYLQRQPDYQVSYISNMCNLAIPTTGMDLFLLIDPAPTWPRGIESLPCPTVGYLIDVHVGLHSRLLAAQFFDVVFVAHKDYVGNFIKAGINAHWLPVGCDPIIHSVPGLVRNIDVAFIGQMGYKGSARYEILTKVLSRFRSNDRNRFYTPREMSAIYGQAKIVFNASINGDLNMRVFEALASGALLVTDRIANGLNDLFQENIHYVGYTTIEEAIEKVSYYLEHKSERELIARQGYDWVLQHHTYGHRYRTIEHIVKTSLPQARSPLRNGSRELRLRAYCGMLEALRKPECIRTLMHEEGISMALIMAWIRATLRKINAHVPLTPGAINAYIRGPLFHRFR